MNTSKAPRKTKSPRLIDPPTDLLALISEVISLRAIVLQAELHARVSPIRNRAQDPLSSGHASKPIELPPQAAKVFVRDTRPFFQGREPTQAGRDGSAA